MDITDSIKALGALAQESRLQAFRLLVCAGADGLPAGDIARSLEIPHNTLSTHLATLSNAGLVSARRESRHIIYTVDYATTRELLSFLLEDCCQGSPEFCRPALDSLLTACCGPK